MNRDLIKDLYLSGEKLKVICQKTELSIGKVTNIVYNELDLPRRMVFRTNKELSEIKRLYISENKSAKEIALKMGFSHSKVKSILSHYGVIKHKDFDVDRMIQLRNQGYTIAEIAGMLDTTVNKVSYKLSKMGLTNRRQSS